MKNNLISSYKQNIKQWNLEKKGIEGKKKEEQRNTYYEKDSQMKKKSKKNHVLLGNIVMGKFCISLKEGEK